MRLALKLFAPIAVTALLLAGCGSQESPGESCAFDTTVDGVTAIQQAGEQPALSVGENAKVPTELVAKDLCEGSGTAAEPTSKVTVNYIGVGYKSREVFDSSFQRGQPVPFQLNQVIKGWQEGVAGMKPGGARLLLIPAELAYGANPPSATIKKNESLAFIVEVVDVQPPPPAPAGADCTFDTTVDGVTAEQKEPKGTPTLSVAKDAKVPTELVTNELCPGEGTPATVEDEVTIDYVLVGYKSRKVIGSSFQAGQSTTLKLNSVLTGLRDGIVGMTPGSSRLLLVPAKLAYGANPPAGGPIAKNESLAFVVALHTITAPSPSPS